MRQPPLSRWRSHFSSLASPKVSLRARAASTAYPVTEGVALLILASLAALASLHQREQPKNRREKKRWKSIERLKVLHYQKRFEASPTDEGFTCPASLSLTSPLLIRITKGFASRARESERPLVIRLSPSVSPKVSLALPASRDLWL